VSFVRCSHRQEPPSVSRRKRLKPVDRGCSLRKIGRSLLRVIALSRLIRPPRLNCRRQTGSGQETYRNLWIAAFSANNQSAVKLLMPAGLKPEVESPAFRLPLVATQAKACTLNFILCSPRLSSVPLLNLASILPPVSGVLGCGAVLISASF
jgi:hypothetical protein